MSLTHLRPLKRRLQLLRVFRLSGRHLLRVVGRRLLECGCVRIARTLRVNCSRKQRLHLFDTRTTQLCMNA